MPPSGPRARPAQQPAVRPSATARNEAFESIFGRPAGGHHLGTNPAPAPTPAPPLPGGTYGYTPFPPPAAGGYRNPAQPSFPPGQVYAQAPPRAAPQPYPQQAAYGGNRQAIPEPQGVYPQRAWGSGSGAQYGPSVTQQSQQPAGYLSRTADGLPDRRASLAPSTYSMSSASYYSPNPDSSPPLAPLRNERLPSLTYPSPPAASGSRPAQPSIGLSAAQAYQASQRRQTADSSPASVVFPHRPGATPSANLPASSASVSSFTTSSSSGSQPYRSSSNTSHSYFTSRSPPPDRTDNQERLISPPPDYMRAMDNLGFDGKGGGPLDAVPGIPSRQRNERDLKGLDRERSEEALQTSSTSIAPSHRRMASDSSFASSAYTAVNSRPQLALLSQIDPSNSALADSPYGSPTTPTASEMGTFATHAAHRLSAEKSLESTQSLPLPDTAPDFTLPPGAAPSAVDSRATSFSGSARTRKEAVGTVRSGSVGHGANQRSLMGRPPSSYAFPTPHPSQRSLSGTLNRSTSTQRAAVLHDMPHIYPALLSRVAEAFKQLITLNELVKDGIAYKDSFDGKTAVGVVADIIKTPDRNLALLLGRALDAQKFFHDVTYDHRLRDNPHEVYQFKERLTAPFIGENNLGDSPSSDQTGLTRAALHNRKGRAWQPTQSSSPETASGSLHTSESQTSFFQSVNPTPATSSTSLAYPADSPRAMTKISSEMSVPTGLASYGDADESEDDLPVGVFTLLTDCYSPTCSREQLCYSINCPRRLEQMKRLNMKPQPGLSRKLSNESIHGIKETGTLWTQSVSQEILDSVSDTEKKRQEAINEVMYTERDFVRDLEYLRDSWVKPLRTQEVIAAARRDDFVQQVFWNVHDVLAVNTVLGERLTKRQKQHPVVHTIGDIFLERVPLFEPFVTYGAHQLFGKYEFEKEKGANPAFQRFVDETERKPESRKLELNGYLTKPTTRLGRYPLLLEAVLKYTSDDNPDKKDLPGAIKMIKSFLTKVNIESGKSENVFELAQLEQQLVFRPNETIDLRLRDKNRELVYKGPLKRRGGNRDEIADLMAFLFDHAFLLVKPKYVNKAEQYRVYRRPIPLELLVVLTPEDRLNSSKLSMGPNRLITSRSVAAKTTSGTHAPPKPESKHGFSVTIIHLGKKGYSMQLWVDTYVGRKKWLEHIDKQQNTLRERSCVFTAETITDGFFGGLRKIRCISPYDNGNRMIYGTDEGVYFSNLRDEKLREPVKVINLLDVTQVDVIEEFQLLIVLHERSVTTFPLECLDPNDSNAALKRGKRISSHTSFFKSGICLGKMLVAVVKSSTLSSTIKVLEPVDLTMRGKKQQGSFMRRLNPKEESLRLFKEFYIPTESSSVHFLKTKLCVGCTKGFEIVDLETLDMQGLLDPSDSSLDFVLKRDNVRPIAIYRIEEDFLLCYDEFAFYVNKNGWRARPKWAIIWEGLPTAFALQYPYVIAFEPTFIEVHHVESGHLVQIIPAGSISCLFADTPPSRINAPIIPPNRQLMYPPGTPHRPPIGQTSYSAYSQSPYPPQAGYAQQQGMMRPPMAPPHHSYGVPPPAPIVPRYARTQMIFTADDGHVQFLRLPPQAQRSGAHISRPSY